jgi:hypothetical protein
MIEIHNAGNVTTFPTAYAAFIALAHELAPEELQRFALYDMRHIHAGRDKDEHPINDFRTPSPAKPRFGPGATVQSPYRLKRIVAGRPFACPSGTRLTVQRIAPFTAWPFLADPVYVVSLPTGEQLSVEESFLEPVTRAETGR